MSSLFKDVSNNAVQLMVESAPQVVAVNGSAGAAVLSAAFTMQAVRVHCSVDMFVLFTVAGAVTATTGHYRVAGACYDMPVPAGTTKLSALAVGTGAGVLYISELG
jgi:RecJ-like exonuclease